MTYAEGDGLDLVRGAEEGRDFGGVIVVVGGGGGGGGSSPSAEAEIVEARMGRLMLEAAAADDAAAVGREAAANASQGLIPAARSEIVSRRHRVMMFEMMVSTLLTNYGT